MLPVGLPLFFMELGVGQYASVGPARLFSRMQRMSGGLGWGMVTISFIVTIYYNMVIAWTLFYLYAGLTDTLPWER